MDRDDLGNRFKYHKPNETAAERHEDIRDTMLSVACLVDNLVPNGREKSLAITALEEAMMWANAGIARIAEDGTRR